MRAHEGEARGHLPGRAAQRIADTKAHGALLGRRVRSRQGRKRHARLEALEGRSQQPGVHAQLPRKHELVVQRRGEAISGEASLEGARLGRQLELAIQRPRAGDGEDGREQRAILRVVGLDGPHGNLPGGGERQALEPVALGREDQDRGSARSERQAIAAVRIREAGGDGALLADEDVRERTAIRIEDLAAHGLLGMRRQREGHEALGQRAGSQGHEERDEQWDGK
ncbi:hypothetical protein D3C87_1158330 [compost metagenome]